MWGQSIQPSRLAVAVNAGCHAQLYYTRQAFAQQLKGPEQRSKKHICTSFHTTKHVDYIERMPV